MMSQMFSEYDMIAVWVDSIDFSKGDKAFIYPDGNHLIIQDDDNVDTYALMHT